MENNSEAQHRKEKTAYVICVNDYPVEVSFLSEDDTCKRVAEMQVQLNVEGGGIWRAVHYHCCPIIEGE